MGNRECIILNVKNENGKEERPDWSRTRDRVI